MIFPVIDGLRAKPTHASIITQLTELIHKQGTVSTKASQSVADLRAECVRQAVKVSNAPVKNALVAGRYDEWGKCIEEGVYVSDQELGPILNTAKPLPTEKWDKIMEKRYGPQWDKIVPLNNKVEHLQDQLDQKNQLIKDLEVKAQQLVAEMETEQTEATQQGTDIFGRNQNPETMSIRLLGENDHPITIKLGQSSDATKVFTKDGKQLELVTKLEILYDPETYLPAARLTFLNPKIETA